MPAIWVEVNPHSLCYTQVPHPTHPQSQPLLTPTRLPNLLPHSTLHPSRAYSNLSIIRYLHACLLPFDSFYPHPLHFNPYLRAFKRLLTLTKWCFTNTYRCLITLNHLLVFTICNSEVNFLKVILFTQYVNPTYLHFAM